MGGSGLAGAQRRLSQDNEQPSEREWMRTGCGLDSSVRMEATAFCGALFRIINNRSLGRLKGERRWSGGCLRGPRRPDWALSLQKGPRPHAFGAGRGASCSRVGTWLRQLVPQASSSPPGSLGFSLDAQGPSCPLSVAVSVAGLGCWSGR